jgi:hypothetical protein
VRALAASDAASARALLQSSYANSRHLARALELLAVAVRGDDPECLGLISPGRDAGAGALLLYGNLAGASGVCRIQLLAGDDAHLTRLLRAMLDLTRNARIFICELPVGAEHAVTAEALAAAGFMREGGIADFFAEGVALDLLVLRA